MFKKTFDLATLNGINGFSVEGLQPQTDVFDGDQLGISVNTAGDINGDGLSDILIGAYNAYNYQGAGYVIFGQKSFAGKEYFDLNTLNGTNGFIITGQEGNKLGYIVSTAGDMNGDGFSDIAISNGCFSDCNDNERIYVIFGQKTFPALLDLTTFNTTNGFVILDFNSKVGLGSAISAVGDINGDGKDDIVLGALEFNNSAGAIFVIFGQRSFPAQLDLKILNGTNGFSIHGLKLGDMLGWSVSGAGDMNGDGLTDIILGAPGFNFNNSAGASYVIFGQKIFPAQLDLKILNGTNGFRILTNMTAASYPLGKVVSTVGDVNNDGKSDIILGTQIEAGTEAIGKSYIIFGQGNFLSHLYVETLNGTDGFCINGLNFGNYLSGALNTVGDINGDGFSDIVVGNPLSKNSSYDGLGVSYIIFGQKSFPALIVPEILNNEMGFSLLGGGSQFLGSAFSTLKDINGDGIADFILGALASNNYAGASYIIFGKFPLRAGNISLVIKQARTFIITSEQLSAIDLNDCSSELIFNITQLQGGYFSRRNDSQSVSVFLQMAITNNQIEFIQDGSPRGVSYQVTITNGAVSLPAQTANVTFILTEPFVYRPFPNQTVVVGQSFNLIIPNDTFISRDQQPLAYALQVINQTYLPAWLYFANQTRQLSGIADMRKLLILNLTVTDPYQLSATTYFSLQAGYLPQVINNILTIKQGRTILITPLDLSANNLEGALEEVQFTIHQVEGGWFKWRNSSSPILAFPQQAIFQQQIEFVQDGSVQGVAYYVMARNFIGASVAAKANVTFILTQPVLYRPLSDYTVQVNQPFKWTFPKNTFISPDHQTLTYGMQQADSRSLPDWVQFNTTSLEMTGFPPSAGTSRFSLFARDVYDLSANTQFNLISKNEPIPLLVWLLPLCGGVLGLTVLLGLLMFKRCRQQGYESIDEDEGICCPTPSIKPLPY